MSDIKQEREAADRSSGDTITGIRSDDVGQTLGSQASTSAPHELGQKSNEAQESLQPPQSHESPMVPEADDALVTPRSEVPSLSTQIYAQPLEAGDVNFHASNAPTAATVNYPGDYFGATAWAGNAAEFLRTPLPATPGGASEQSQPSPEVNHPAQGSFGEPLATWKPTSPQMVKAPTSDPRTIRPTSVPDFAAPSLSQSKQIRDTPPRYPDQSFASLGPTPTPPPPPSRIMRTRSSHSPNWSMSSNSDSTARDPARNHSGARTVGHTPAHTPAQSPGLYSPTSVMRRAPESDDGRPSSQVLQAAHLQAPIETHKLNKEVDPATGRKVLNNYELIDKIGSGQHGTVKRGRNMDTNEIFAVKIVRRFQKKLRLGRSGDPNDMIKKEVAILKKARHPHVVSLFEVIDDPEFDKVYLVLEYVERGEIVWRKETEQSIARFEMRRLQRETEHGYHADHEIRLIEEFNYLVPARKEEEIRKAEDQKRRARGLLESGEPIDNMDFDHFLLREQCNKPESRMAGRTHHQAVQNHDERLSRADIHDAENPGKGPKTASPVYNQQTLSISQVLSTDFSASQPSSLPTSAPSSAPPSQPASQPPSRPSSRPHSPGLEGTMYGAYVEPEKTKSDLEYQYMLNKIFEEEQEEWTWEEDFFRHVPCLTLGQALDAFRDTVLGLEYLHYQGIIHRDIKPANLLWTHDYRVKISDFGVSYLGKPMRGDSNHEDLSEADSSGKDEAVELAKTVGTPAFYAPELCDPSLYDPANTTQRLAITNQIDVWALGVTLYGMIFGRLPFYHPNEFVMYDMIARDNVFIPRLRLKGVSHNNKTPSDHHKRRDDILEYEEVDDTLRDLLKRLLAKHPHDRITLREVKHHPWVVSGIENKDSWLDETDPSRHSEGKKIEVSTQEVQDAVVGVSALQSVVKGVQRLASVFSRGGRSRKRTTSNPKMLDQPSSASTSTTREDRRASLRGDDQLYLNALKHSRDGVEHPLAQSVAASPDMKHARAHAPTVSGDLRPFSANDLNGPDRPLIAERSVSLADPMKTVTARDSIPSQGILAASEPSYSTEDFSTSTATVVEGQSSSTTSLGGIFGAGRPLSRLANTFRSRDRTGSRQSPSQSSRSSSVDTGNYPAAEDYHASPSLGISSAIATGHVDQPPALREEWEDPLLLTNPPSADLFPNQSSSESFQQTREISQRPHQSEHARLAGGHRRSVSYAPDAAYSPSPYDDTFYQQQQQQRPASATESSFAISSSSDQMISGESAAHSRVPSVVSGDSSLSGTVEDDPHRGEPLNLEKSISPLTTSKRADEKQRRHPVTDDPLNTGPALSKAQQEEEAGYNGEPEQDSDSDDEGLAMA